MSKAAFNKTFMKPLLKRLDKDLRKDMIRKKGQILILEDTKELEKAIKAVLGEDVFTARSNNPKVAMEAVLEEGQKSAYKLQKRFKRDKKFTRRYNAISSKIPEIRLPAKFRQGTNEESDPGNMFILTSYRSVDTVKKHMLKKLVDLKILTKDEKAKVSTKTQIGHGVRGKAVSQARISGSTANISSEQQTRLLQNLSAATLTGQLTSVEYRNIRKLIVNGYQQVTKKGGLKATYAPILTLQEGLENQGVDSQEEKALLNSFKAFMSTLTPKLMGMEGSSTLEEKIAAMALMGLTPKKAKVKSNLKNTKLKTTSKGEGSVKSKKPNVSLARGSIRRAKVEAKRDRTSIVNLIGILSNRINETVAKNMGTMGRLVYRSGDFANSVEITDVVQTPQGFPSVGYTYALYPYQTFEPGYVQGSAERDPRKLIDASIREIAANLAIGRFYTRRV